MTADSRNGPGGNGTVSEATDEGAATVQHTAPQGQQWDLTGDALAYAANGWQVFPLGRRKAPRFPKAHPDDPAAQRACKGTCPQVGHGFYDATDDPDLIRSWTPWALIGGRVPTGLIAIDVDPPRGEETLADLEATYGPLPATMTVFSGKGDGGRHLYYARPAGRLVQRRLGPGLDLLHHDLRYGVLPPSPHPISGLPYQWGPVRTVAQPPRWLAALLAPPPAVRRRRLSTPGHTGAGSRLGDWLRRQDRTPGSGRHDLIFWALCTAAEDQLAPAEVETVKEAAVELGWPDYDRAEIDRLWGYAAAKGVAV